MAKAAEGDGGRTKDHAAEPHSRIHRVLRFITKADIAVIQAADLIEILEGDENPQAPADLLKPWTFVVNDPTPNHPQHTFNAKLTQAQIDYLNSQLKPPPGTLAQLDAALLNMLVWSGKYVVNALNDLAGAVAASDPSSHSHKKAASGPGGGGIDPPALGCCYYDTHLTQNDLTESYCEGALQGQWSPNPCTSRPPHTDS
jgi:hypothetical protein